MATSPRSIGSSPADRSTSAATCRPALGAAPHGGQADGRPTTPGPPNVDTPRCSATLCASSVPPNPAQRGEGAEEGSVVRPREPTGPIPPRTRRRDGRVASVQGSSAAQRRRRPKATAREPSRVGRPDRRARSRKTCRRTGCAPLTTREGRGRAWRPSRYGAPATVRRSSPRQAAPAHSFTPRERRTDRRGSSRANRDATAAPRGHEV